MNGQGVLQESAEGVFQDIGQGVLRWVAMSPSLVSRESCMSVGRGSFLVKKKGVL
jgi:hypothetical protein